LLKGVMIQKATASVLLMVLCSTVEATGGFSLVQSATTVAWNSAAASWAMRSSVFTVPNNIPSTFFRASLPLNSSFQSYQPTGIIQPNYDPITTATYTSGGSTAVMMFGVTQSQPVVTSKDGVAWTNGTSAPPYGQRFSFCAAALGSTVFLIGGSSGSTVYNDCWQSSNDGVTWTMSTAAVFSSGRQRLACASWAPLGLIAVGGQDAAFTNHNDLWTSTNGVNWVLKSSTPYLRFDSWTPFVLNNNLYLTGSWDDAGFVYNVTGTTDGLNWTAVTPGPIDGARSVVVYANTAYLIGGYNIMALTVTTCGTACPNFYCVDSLLGAQCTNRTLPSTGSSSYRMTSWHVILQLAVSVIALLVLADFSSY